MNPWLRPAGPVIGVITWWVLVHASTCVSAAPPGQPEYATAPPNYAVVGDTLNGWYFVPQEFKKQYEATLARLESLQVNIDLGHIKAAEAQAELAELKERLESLRQTIDDSRVLITGATIHEQTETTEFELGPERRLAITTNHVHVIGWDDPQVKVELKKMVLAPDDKPVDEHLQAIQVVHEHGPAKFAGQTDADWDAQEREFLARQGAQLTEQQLVERREFVKSIRDSYAIHRDYVGKQVDLLTVAGLEYDHNQSITLGVKSEGGEGRLGSVRQRYAELTVYVPRCAGVCIRGARRGLLVEGLDASLTIVDEDSTDTDHRGRFEVHDLRGNLVSRDFPLRRIIDVEGHVTVAATQEFGVEGGGTRHFDDLRDLTPARPITVQVQGVSDGVDLRFGRVSLDLREIGGQMSVYNEFGDTTLTAHRPFAATAHRIISQSGRIDVELSSDAWASTPIVAVTNHGGIRTNVPREEFEDFHLGGTDRRDHIRRDWPGFRTHVDGEGPLAVFNLLDRFSAAMEAQKRSAGLDLVSRSGRIAVLRK